VTPITVATRAPGEEIKVGNQPTGLAISNTLPTPTLLVVDSASNAVTPILVANLVAGSTITVGRDPDSIAVAPDGVTAYVTDRGSDEVTPISVGPNVAGDPIAVGVHPTGVAFTPDQPPRTRLSASFAPVGSVSHFDASRSSVAVGYISNYAWNFGDGVQTATVIPEATHVYRRAGNFTVSLVETDSAGTALIKIFTGQTMSNNGGATAQASVVGKVPVAR
jgi:YVTN family beta-propeller protein